MINYENGAVSTNTSRAAVIFSVDMASKGIWLFLSSRTQVSISMLVLFDLRVKVNVPHLDSPSLFFRERRENALFQATSSWEPPNPTTIIHMWPTSNLTGKTKGSDLRGRKHNPSVCLHDVQDNDCLGFLIERNIWPLVATHLFKIDIWATVALSSPSTNTREIFKPYFIYFR